MLFSGAKFRIRDDNLKTIVKIDYVTKVSYFTPDTACNREWKLEYMNSFKEIVSGKKRGLSQQVELPLAELADNCLAIWHDPNALDRLLQMGVGKLPEHARLYIVERDGKQRSSTITAHTINSAMRGRDVSSQANFAGTLPFKGMCLSGAYLSPEELAPCISAIQAIGDNDELLGFLLADFSIQNLHLDQSNQCIPRAWRQFKGDPAIRGTVFQQERVFSLMDEYMDDAIDVLGTLIRQHGIFHAKLHFSSSRATFWCIQDPFNYRLHSVEEFIDPDVCLAYSPHPYPAEAQVSPEDVAIVLNYFKLLRIADDNIYLRSASLNIMNSLVGLTFSCDGTHYIPVNEFLQKDMAFWFGSGELLKSDREAS